MYSDALPRSITPDAARTAYADFLRDDAWFRSALVRVLSEWPIACEHFLSNEHINRIAWLGQASMCIATGIPSCYRAGFKLLTNAEQDRANATAAWALHLWRRDHDAQEAKPKQGHLRLSMPTGTAREKISAYIFDWSERGYLKGIPDSVPSGIARLRLAPSYMAIAHCILKNDLHFAGLGYTPPRSPWYGVLKHAEKQKEGLQIDTTHSPPGPN